MVWISDEAFSVLCSYTSLIQKNFEEESGKYGSILLGAQVTQSFSSCEAFGEGTWSLFCNNDPSEKVTMEKSPIDGFVKVIPLINYVKTKYMSNQNEATSFFASLYK
jgi:hypothetical protein